LILMRTKTYEIGRFLGIGFSCNVYSLIHGDEVTLIDSGISASLAERLLEELRKIKASIVEKFSPNVYAHFNEAEAIMEGDESRVLTFMFPYGYTPVKVTHVVEDGDLINLSSGDGLRVIHTPGHTSGSICIFDEKNKILFTGDTIFANGAVGRVDLPSGDAEQLIKSLEKLSQLDVIAFFPGHEEPVMYNASQEIKEIYNRIKMYL
jgi:hydroxyacylglutathione hydrolase